MIRPPLLATVLVGAATGAMIALGVWQLRRAEWKEALLARYARAGALPPAVLGGGETGEALLFRRATADCRPPIRWSVLTGADRAGRSGWRHVAACGGLSVDMGWSAGFADRPSWNGGAVAGVVAPLPEGRSLLAAATLGRRAAPILLVADRPAPGLAPSAPPDLAAIPNNHRAYAVQWFLFAGVAGIIYALALRRRRTR